MKATLLTLKMWTYAGAVGYMVIRSFMNQIDNLS
jgi:hypothetical protein